MTKYIEINDRKHYLDEYGEMTIPASGRYLQSRELESLGFEIHTEGPKFEDIPAGIYSPGGESYNPAFGLHEGQWYSAGGGEATDGDVARLRAWHHRGRLIKLEKGKATNE